MTTVDANPAPVEQLWVTPDGTACLLSTCDSPPIYSVSLVRDTEVLRERRLFGRSAAQMVADSWSEAVRK